MNYESLRGKYVLFDTNVVINFGRYQRFYQPVIDNLFEYNVLSVISGIIKVELYAYTRSEKERQDVTDLLLRLNLHKSDPEGSRLPFRKELIDTAIKLGQRYQQSGAKAGKPVQLGDLLIGAEMLLYKDSGMLVLATENHEDFPRTVFDRIGIETIDCEDSIHNVGFYTLKPSALL